jgi:tetratricopeptide (TPR) repeat protein
VASLPCPPRGAALVLSRAPAAQGELRPAVAARLLHQLWRSQADGALALDDGVRGRSFFFRRGVPVAWQSEDPAESLAGTLHAAGRLDERGAIAAVAAMAAGHPTGAALVAAGALEPGAPVVEALRAHLRAALARAVALREGRWRFHAGAEFAGELEAVEVLPLQPILEGARAGIPARHLAEALQPVAEAFPSRTAELQQVLPVAGLAAADLALAISVDGRTRTREWLEGRGAALREALPLLWFLALVGGVAFHAGPEGADGAAPPPARRRPALPPDRGEAVRREAARILTGNYFQALGVDLAADAAELERAHREVAARFHPDAFSGHDVSGLADLLAAVQEKVGAAYQVLSAPERRAPYLAFLLHRPERSGARQVAIDVEAEVALKRGERALRARRISDALDAFREAVARNPREPEYLAMLGFTALHDPALPPSERAHEARRSAARALALSPSHPRAAAVLALAAEALGELEEARRVAEVGLAAAPESVVLREVRARLGAG